jgi:hypothetical protein
LGEDVMGKMNPALSALSPQPKKTVERKRDPAQKSGGGAGTTVVGSASGGYRQVVTRYQMIGSVPDTL